MDLLFDLFDALKINDENAMLESLTAYRVAPGKSFIFSNTIIVSHLVTFLGLACNTKVDAALARGGPEKLEFTL